MWLLLTEVHLAALAASSEVGTSVAVAQRQHCLYQNPAFRVHDPPDPAPPLLLPRMCSWTFARIYSIPARWVLLEAARFAVTIGEAVKGRSSRSQFDKDALWGRQLCRDVERLVLGHLLGSLLLHGAAAAPSALWECVFR